MLIGVDSYFPVFKLCLYLEKVSEVFEGLKGLLLQEDVIIEQVKGRKQ